MKIFRMSRIYQVVNEHFLMWSHNLVPWAIFFGFGGVPLQIPGNEVGGHTKGEGWRLFKSGLA